MVEKNGFNLIPCTWPDGQGSVRFAQDFAEELKLQYGNFSLRVGEQPGSIVEIVYELQGTKHTKPLLARISGGEQPVVTPPEAPKVTTKQRKSPGLLDLAVALAQAGLGRFTS